jgi:hypothetical protein|tara:strand:- start:28 stop:264 length:237 start_codon:yes stop_codon:yes gene_type:complete
MATWAIDITLRRTYDGTKEEAVELANEDWDYYESQLDGGEFVSFPQALEVYEVHPLGGVVVSHINNKYREEDENETNG